MAANTIRGYIMKSVKWARTKYSEHMFGIAVIFCLVVFSLVLFMNQKSTYDMENILEQSVESQLISIAYAAREIIPVDEFMSYNSARDMEADLENYLQIRDSMRNLAENVGAEYIYALKMNENGNAIFVFDTDTEDEEVFIEYELYEVHEAAFAGNESAGILNVVDEYGSFNTGAVPIMYEGAVAGIIGVDLEDTYIRESKSQALFNTILLCILMVLVMGCMLKEVYSLSRRLADINAKLQRDAYYDIVTQLPNRKYLMEYLHVLTEGSERKDFALLFIDLDNFKKVNDTAGHDAGDELLREIGSYLDQSADKSISFRPTAGRLNIAARVGGDEFVQVVSGISSEHDAEQVVEKLLKGFQSKGFEHYISKYKLGMSIGVALYPYHTGDFNVLIKYADIAMYHAKQSGKNTGKIYSEDMMGKNEK